MLGKGMANQWLVWQNMKWVGQLPHHDKQVVSMARLWCPGPQGKGHESWPMWPVLASADMNQSVTFGSFTTFDPGKSFDVKYNVQFSFIIKPSLHIAQMFLFTQVLTFSSFQPVGAPCIFTCQAAHGQLTCSCSAKFSGKGGATVGADCPRWQEAVGAKTHACPHSPMNLAEGEHFHCPWRVLPPQVKMCGAATVQWGQCIRPHWILPVGAVAPRWRRPFLQQIATSFTKEMPWST